MNSKNPALHSLLKLVGDRNTITVHKAVVDFVGSLETAILFEQLLYWQTKAHEGRIAKTDAELMEETYLSRYALRKARKELEAMELIKVDVSGFGGHKSTVYIPDMGVIEREWATFVGNQTNGENEGPIRLKSDNQSSEIEQSNTETTTERSVLDRNKKSEPSSPPPTPSPNGESPETREGAEPDAEERHRIHGEVLKTFQEETGLKPPFDEEQRKRWWWEPIGEICVLADLDEELACTLMYEAIHRNRERDLSIARPYSVMNSARAIVAERTLGDYVHPDWRKADVSE